MGAGLKKIALFVVALILAVSADVLLASSGGCTTIVYGDATRAGTGTVLTAADEKKTYFNKLECLPGTRFPIKNTIPSMDKGILISPTKARSIDPRYVDVFYCHNSWEEKNSNFICR